MIKFFIFLFFVSSIYADDTLYPSMTYTTGKGSYRFDAGISMFTSSGVFAENGEKTELSENESFSYMNIDGTAYYGLSDDFDVSLGARMRRLNTDYQISGVDFNTAIMEFESFIIGAKYRFYKSKDSNFSFEGSFRNAVYENNEFTNISNVPAEEIALGDDGTEITIAVAGDVAISKSTFLQGRLGYRIPGNDLSEELPYKAEIVLRKESWAFSFGSEGVVSMSSDPFEANPSAKPLQGRAPSLSFNSVNRSFHSIGAGAAFKAGSWLFGGHFYHIYSGASTDAGQTMQFNVSYIPNSKKSQKSVRKDNFRDYDIEGEVIKVSSKANFFRIDKGLTDGVVIGMRFDIYRTNMRSLNELVAEAVVHKVSSNGAILKITNRFLRKRVKYGFVARARL